jgi:hypothetical protein
MKRLSSAYFGRCGDTAKWMGTGWVGSGERVVLATVLRCQVRRFQRAVDQLLNPGSHCHSQHCLVSGKFRVRNQPTGTVKQA